MIGESLRPLWGCWWRANRQPLGKPRAGSALSSGALCWHMLLIDEKGVQALSENHLDNFNQIDCHRTYLSKAADSPVTSMAPTTRRQYTNDTGAARVNIAMLDQVIERPSYCQVASAKIGANIVKCVIFLRSMDK